MIELRRDYVLERWSYIALGRGGRPQEMESRNNDSAGDVCFFCPGNESLTPLEIGRAGDMASWKIRWFPNKFPAVEPSLKQEIMVSDEFFVKGEGFGYHEVIVETPDHQRQLADLSKEEIREVLKVYSQRMAELSQKDGISYVQIFKNSGAKAGTSLVHSHTQILAGSLIPRSVQEKIEIIKQYHKRCPYCEVVKREETGERFICANESFIAFTSFAPRFNFEAMIFPKKHYKNITEITENEFGQLAEVFQKVLSKLGEINAPYNFYLHYAPDGEDLHFHFEITPRLNTWAGFELASGSFVITVSPEEAAAFYRK